jgi:hypothetical protein
MAEVEIYTPTGVLAGDAAQLPPPHDHPDLPVPLVLGPARWYPIDGSPPTQHPGGRIDPDEMLVVTSDVPELKVHLAWYPITLDVGPYRVSGQLGMHPGFDAARALVRPGGAFVVVNDATIELIDQPGAGLAERPYVHVNRYAVDRVASTLMLGFHFPGAELVAKEPIAIG